MRLVPLLIICLAIAASNARAQATSPEVSAISTVPTIAPTVAKVATETAVQSSKMDLSKAENPHPLLIGSVLGFAAQDHRYSDIDPMSYYGVKLSRLKKKMEVEGMTPGNQAALAELYKSATDAVKTFTSHEQQ